jgi:glutamine cyclotransferase
MIVGVKRFAPDAPSRRRGRLLLGLGVVLLAGAGLWAWKGRAAQASSWVSTYEVVKAYPHDPLAYCQGLLFSDGHLYESTGRENASSVRRVELETGKVLQRTELPPPLFGEGLARVGDRLIQLTWTNKVARIYDANTLAPLDQFEYQGEGWGLTYDGENLIQSDGSEVLVFRDPKTFAEVRRVRVLNAGQPVTQINELEMVEGEIWANVWKFDVILRIDPQTGKVLGFVDLTGIFDRRTIPDPDAVLNGIAYDPVSKRLFVTGKLWPKLFEIKVVSKE